MASDFFRLKERNTNVRTEIIAGLVTFMTMAYIIFVNPSILVGKPGEPGMGGEFFSALIIATALAAGLVTLAMGLFAKYPFALASGMGLNASVVGLIAAGHSWQVAMGVVFVEGILVTVLVLTKTREAVMNAIPTNLKRGIGVGIGLFLGYLGLLNAQIVGNGENITKTLVVAAIGLLITAFLMARKVKGSILIGIILTTIVAVIADWIGGGEALVKMPDAIAAFPKAEHFKTFFALDIVGALKLSLVGAILAFMVTDFFDTMGTVVAVAGEGGLLDKNNKLPGLNRVLLVDSLAAVTGGLFGCSSVTTYVESAAGVGEGGRTGLTSVVVGILFLLSIFFYPIIGIVPAAATAPALIIVGFLMLTVVKDMTWNDFDEAFSAYLVVILIPLAKSIATGIGWGFIAYVLIKVLRGKFKEVHPFMYIAALVFLFVLFVLPVLKAHGYLI